MALNLWENQSNGPLCLPMCCQKWLVLTMVEEETVWKTAEREFNHIKVPLSSEVFPIELLFKQGFLMAV